MKKQYVMTRYVCSNCGYIGSPSYLRRGSFAAELILWFLFLVPGFIYSLWRSAERYPVCPKCQTSNMIPGDTPKGKEMIEKQGVEPTYTARISRKHYWVVLWVLLAVLILAMLVFYLVLGNLGK